MELKPRVIFRNECYPLLLIVPYGIETIAMSIPQRVYDSFNRTLWN